MADSNKKPTGTQSAAGQSTHNTAHNTAIVLIDGQTKEIDLMLLSQKVYQLLQQELRIERERIGR